MGWKRIDVEVLVDEVDLACMRRKVIHPGCMNEHGIKLFGLVMNPSGYTAVLGRNLC